MSGLKAEVEKNVEEMANAMASGYSACYDRLACAGVDLIGHSFDDNCANLAKELEGKGDGKAGTN